MNLSIFEICMVVMAISTVAAAVSTMAKNIVHTLGVRRASKLADQAGVGAQIGAVLGGFLESMMHSNVALKAKLLEKQKQELTEALQKMAQVLARQEQELVKARRPPTRFVAWLKAQFPPKKGEV